MEANSNDRYPYDVMPASGIPRPEHGWTGFFFHLITLNTYITYCSAIFFAVISVQHFQMNHTFLSIHYGHPIFKHVTDLKVEEY